MWKPRVWALAPIWLALSGIGHSAEPLRDVVIGAGEDEIRIRVSVTIDGRPVEPQFADAHRSYIDLLFRQLDHDGDGSLSAEEAAAAPAPETVLPDSVLAGEENVNVAFNFRAVDDDGDGLASADELQLFYEHFGGGVLRVLRRTQPSVSGQVDSELYGLLDADGDARISFAEAANAAQLTSLDRDLNELVTAEEIVPAAAGTSGDPLRDRVRMRSPIDESADLDVELRLFRDGRTPELDVQAYAIGVAVAAITPFEHDWSSRTRTGQLRILRTASNHLETTRRALALEFSAVAEDGRSVPVDARLPEVLSDRASLLDADGNGVIEASELESYSHSVLELEAAMCACQAQLTIVTGADGLFAALDFDRDGRLSLRELTGAADRLRRLDRDGNELLTRNELTSGVRLEFAQGDLPPPYAAGSEREGPQWFRRMDRNRDGVVSGSEFLGRSAEFQRFDANGDGWIDLDEAFAVEQLY